LFKHILVPTDGSQLSTKAIRMGVDLAALCGARVTILNCSPPYKAFVIDTFLAISREQYESIARGAALRTLDYAEGYAREKGVAATTEHLFDELPHRAIVQAADKLGCDAIAMASHGRRGAAAVLLGSETSKVLALAKVPVLVCR